MVVATVIAALGAHAPSGAVDPGGSDEPLDFSTAAVTFDDTGITFADTTYTP